MSLTEGQKEWREEAACRDYADRIDDPFFTDEQPLGVPLRGDGQNPGQAWALAICRRCPVKRECFEYEMDYERTHRGGVRGQHFGIWGGTTPRQRKHLRDIERKEAS